MVGKKIRAYREFRGYSQIQLAELSGINVGTIRKYELGIRNPKPDQLEKIATALGLNVSVFLDFNIETVDVYKRQEYILSPKATKAKKKRIKEQLKADKKAAKSQKEADQILSLIHI